tara:strand:+ start:10149 stop:10496 length:348 start_codon:yes stop_codon:yes gene_type:complete
MEFTIVREGNPEWRLILKFENTKVLSSKLEQMAEVNFELKSCIKDWDNVLKGFSQYLAVNIYQFLYACQIGEERRRLRSCQELIWGLCPEIKEVTILSVDAPNVKDHDLTIRQSV